MIRAICLVIVTGVIVGVLVSSRFVSMAQVSGPAGQEPKKPLPSERLPENAHFGEKSERLPENAHFGEKFANEEERRATQPEPRGGSSAATLQDALLRPYDFPFSRPTSLAQVCDHLKQTLKAPVVIDLAALDRQNVEPEDPVQLELQGVRLKTGLKLLLDQVGLTYRIEPEDNLMVITDQEGSQDATERIWAELHALHRDLHDVQDSLDELRQFFGDDRQSGPKVRKPTIIEEMPEGAMERHEQTPDERGNPRERPSGKAGERPSGKPGDKPKGAVAPPGSRELLPRIPLSSPRRDSRKGYPLSDLVVAKASESPRSR